ncbi:carboxypeptidase N subunit 2 [Neocloeon triangulifer]|uniref:carboxypeptidase N subunit 2 n=1 Tax=Neocloeon triangulifer TaxID=2078957 RepID=UPI00286F7AD8|nr:carboxypeptidase N subunit 2 [Neocloeon triangulifer]XP_059482719.1 carboxypeptidase N subunit 2 [Neocloeon triangulifer]
MLRSLLLLVLAGAVSEAALPDLHVPCPEGCACDLSGMPRRVDCSGRNLTEFPQNLHVSTQFLDLSNNLITSLPPRLSHLAPQLETLILKNNLIPFVPGDTFRGLQDLRSVDLSHNQLNTSLPSKLFATNSRIYDLKLSNNPNLTQLGDLVGANFEILDLSFCGFVSISGISFSNLTALRSLNLSFNPLKTFPDKLNVQTLRQLDLNSCNLTSIPAKCLANLPNIQHLHISGNKQLDLPQNPPLQSKALLELTADHCDIKLLALSQLPSLTHGYFSCNKITGVRKENFAKKSALLEIDLSHNLIRELPLDLFVNAKHLVSVDLSSNRIESLQHDLFACCAEMQFLNLSRNDITSLPSVLTMPSVVVFDLSRCRLQSLPSGPNFLSRMSRLDTLYLSHNELKTIPALKSNSLKHLDLSYCHLKQVTHENFKNLTKLHKINLSGNRLTNLNASTFKDNKNLGSLYLYDNPWFCNCTDPEFIKLWELTERLSETGRNTLKCQDPESVSGKFWEDACTILVPSEPTTSARDNTVLLTVILVACLGTIVAAVMCSKKAMAAGRKSSRRRRDIVRNQPERGENSADDDSDEAVSVRVPRTRVHSADTRQCTPCNERQNQVLARAAAEQPPTYEEAVLLSASSVSVAIIDRVVSRSSDDSDSEQNVEVERSVNNTEESERVPQVSEL